MSGFIAGEENQGTINKAKWRNHFIGTKQSLERSYGQEQNRVEKWDNRLLGGFSNDFLNWGRVQS